MPQISYSLNVKEWDAYFKKQAEMQKGENAWQKNKIVYTNASVGGGISSPMCVIGLTRVGVVKDAPAQHSEEKEKVEVNIVSPVEVTVDQAQSELKNIIKDGDPVEASISKQTSKRASSLATPSPKKKPKLQYADIFSKKTTRK